MTEYYMGSSAKKWKCICPHCRKKHVKTLYYTGRIIPPWIRCDDCERYFKRNPSEEDEYTLFDRHILYKEGK